MDTTLLHTGAALLDLTGRGHVVLTGKDRAAFLHGLLTNDIKKLRPGDGCHAALLTPKGKMVADLLVFATPDALVVDSEPALAPGLYDLFKKYLFFQEVAIEDMSATTAVLHVEGPKAAEVLAAAGLGSLPETALSCVVTETGLLARVSRGGAEGFDVRAPLTEASALRDALVTAGAVEAGLDVLEAARIEAGLPRWGAELDETVLPNEAWLERTAISYNKGCYIGQETVARIRTYGHVNRNLVTLRLEPTATAARGESILSGETKVGSVTSAVRSERLQCVVALGYVKRELVQPGTALVVETAGGPAPAVVR